MSILQRYSLIEKREVGKQSDPFKVIWVTFEGNRLFLFGIVKMDYMDCCKEFEF